MELRSFQISLLLAPRPSNAGRETGRRIFLIREHCAYCMNGTIRIYRLSICPVSCLYTDCPYCTEIAQTHRRHGQGCSPRLPPRTATRWTGRAWHAEGTLRIPARRRLTHRIATTSPATPRSTTRQTGRYLSFRLLEPVVECAGDDLVLLLLRECMEIDRVA